MKYVNLHKYFNEVYIKELYKEKLSESYAKGIDKRNSSHFDNNLDSEISLIVRKVNNGEYEFSPYLERLLLKGHDKLPRVISIPTIRDRVVLLVIKEILHEEFSDYVNRTLPNTYIREIRNYISNRKYNYYYYKTDIENFYNSINRKILLDIIKKHIFNPILIDLITKSIKMPTVPINTRRELYKDYYNINGVPQGLSTSNILAQIYLCNFDDEMILEHSFYKRYVDDIIIISKFKNDKLFNYLKVKLNELSLTICEKKTEHDSVSEKFIYLGYEISIDNISIPSKSVESFIRRIASKITWFKKCCENITNRPNWLKDDSRFKEVFIEELNEIITGIITKHRNYGWLFYYSEITDNELLFRIDRIIDKFFSSIKQFNCKRPNSLKKLIRAHKVIKYSKNKNYICNYDKYDTVSKKGQYLIFRGVINSSNDYSNDEIEKFFEEFQTAQIRRHERSLGYNHN